MADDPKADLKARLGLKSRAGAQAPAAPIVPGAPPPEPDKPKGPTQATIDEARRHAAKIKAFRAWILGMLKTEKAQVKR